MFGVVLPRRSFPLDALLHPDRPPHWVSTMNTFVAPTAIPTFLLRRHPRRPPLGAAPPSVAGSRLRRLPGPPSARIGVCLEDLASLPPWPMRSAGAGGAAGRCAWGRTLSLHAVLLRHRRQPPRRYRRHPRPLVHQVPGARKRDPSTSKSFTL
ncbi:unnamed protein product [Spirodela intermedia]|uniref:Uncharacterized protein n=1 Tax=Spirodela intermedia TaxID=51605 RepID=A0A7I8INK2_SPIIN|nr:unnamed protein product [Spirodela intermedia]CAA6659360.1 unnamed protein product [Spirodela intermedia]